MNAGRKWLQIFLDILAYEFDHPDDGQLLSEGADRLVAKHPVLGRAFILFVGEVIVLHLANVLDDRFDLMSKKFWSTIRGILWRREPSVNNLISTGCASCSRANRTSSSVARIIRTFSDGL